MKSFSLLILLFGISYFGAFAQNSCMTEASIKALDAQWEESNLHPNPDFFEKTLAENFIWVHNHLSMVDSKESLIQSAKRKKAAGTSNIRSRTQSDVKVAITGNSAIVTGITFINRDPDPTRYHFMRTYVEVNGTCFLTGNHTMAIPEGEK